ncbi:MAG: hypothetical protein GVY29_07360 [Spirochaetes bacterium]|nr:hypothetical protein [Spirochaetota bacterium]
MQEFWAKTEEELGESVEAYAMAFCASGCVKGDTGLWGLAFVTERALYFHHFQKRNWFMSVLTQDNSRGDQEVKLEVAKDVIVSAEIRSEPSLLKRIFSYSPPVLEIVYRGVSGEAQTMRLALDTQLEDFQRLLSPT